jgi:hypothetical protein
LDENQESRTSEDLQLACGDFVQGSPTPVVIFHIFPPFSMACLGGLNWWSPSKHTEVKSSLLPQLCLGITNTWEPRRLEAPSEDGYGSRGFPELLLLRGRDENSHTVGCKQLLPWWLPGWRWLNSGSDEMYL